MILTKTTHTPYCNVFPKSVMEMIRNENLDIRVVFNRSIIRVFESSMTIYDPTVHLQKIDLYLKKNYPNFLVQFKIEKPYNGQRRISSNIDNIVIVNVLQELFNMSYWLPLWGFSNTADIAFDSMSNVREKIELFQELNNGYLSNLDSSKNIENVLYYYNGIPYLVFENPY